MIEKEKKRRRGKKTVDLGNEIITLENVSKAYATGAPALNGVNLHINRGEFVFIVGDSGSGKSTLIKLLLRELTPTSGYINVMGYDLVKIRHRKIPKFRRNLGIVFQDSYRCQTRKLKGTFRAFFPRWGLPENIRQSPDSSPEGSSREWHWPGL